MVRMETGHRRTESHCDLTYHTRRWHWGAHTPHHILPGVGNEYTWYSNEIQGGETWRLKIVDEGESLRRVL
jgi:hypothetical protein